MESRSNSRAEGIQDLVHVEFPLDTAGITFIVHAGDVHARPIWNGPGRRDRAITWKYHEELGQFRAQFSPFISNKIGAMEVWEGGLALHVIGYRDRLAKTQLLVRELQHPAIEILLEVFNASMQATPFLVGDDANLLEDRGNDMQFRATGKETIFRSFEICNVDLNDLKMLRWFLLYAAQYGTLIEDVNANVLDFGTWALNLNPSVDISQLSFDGIFDLFNIYAIDTCYRPLS
jgi:hypothetical protein